jgi:hypothetical protein
LLDHTSAIILKRGAVEVFSKITGVKEADA